MPQFFFFCANGRTLDVTVATCLFPICLTRTNVFGYFPLRNKSVIADLIESRRALVCPLWWACGPLGFFLSLEIEEREKGRVNER